LLLNKLVGPVACSFSFSLSLDPPSLLELVVELPPPPLLPPDGSYAEGIITGKTAGFYRDWADRADKGEVGRSTWRRGAGVWVEKVRVEEKGGWL